MHSAQPERGPLGRVMWQLDGKLSGPQVDIVGFVDGLLGAVAQLGEVGGELDSETTIRFRCRSGETVQCELSHATGKLRMICARLGALGIEVDPSLNIYGGQYMLPHREHNIQVEFQNQSNQPYCFTLRKKE